MSCSHKFVGTNVCVKCGISTEEIKAAGYDEATRLLHEQTARVAELEATQDAMSIDAVALQKCRNRVAELEDKLSLAVHGQTYDDCVRTLDASKARVAELESHLRVQTAALADDLATERTRIARAVAELDDLRAALGPGEVRALIRVDRALATLRGDL